MGNSTDERCDGYACPVCGIVDGSGPPAASLEGFAAEIEHYLADRSTPSGFTRAVLENNLTAALGAADPLSLLLLPRLVGWLRSSIPARSWGSKEAVRNWLRCGSLREEVGRGRCN